jgi:cytochrome c oxidase subunit 4
MADHHSQPESHGHGGGHHGPVEHAHPGAREYLGIAVVLTVITAIEVAVFYIPSLKSMLVPILLSLSAIKFGMVAMWYMHLKFDARLFSWLFVLPMLLAVGVILALIALFQHAKMVG